MKTISEFGEAEKVILKGKALTDYRGEAKKCPVVQHNVWFGKYTTSPVWCNDKIIGFRVSPPSVYLHMIPLLLARYFFITLPLGFLKKCAIAADNFSKGVKT